MEIILAGVIIAIILFMLITKWLFLPKKQVPEPDGTNRTGYSSTYFTQANTLYTQLDNSTERHPELSSKLIEIIALCELSIARETKNYGDKIFMLAKSYFLLATIYNQTRVYDFCLLRAVALIQNLQDTKMYTSNYQDARKFYTGIMNHVKKVDSIVSQKTRQTLNAILKEKDKSIFSSAITLGEAEKLKQLISSEMSLVLARNFENEGKYEEAMFVYTSLLRIDPNNVLALYARSMALLKCNLLEMAITDIELAIRLDPTNGRLHAGKGLINAARQRNLEALENLDTALSLGISEIGSVHAIRGLILGSLGQVQEANRSFEHSLASSDIQFYGQDTARQIAMMQRLTDGSITERLSERIQPLNELKDAGKLSDEEYVTNVAQLVIDELTKG